MIVLDVIKPLTHRKIIEYELEGFGIRLNKKPPNILIKKKEKGGVNIVKSMGIELTKMSDANRLQTQSFISDIEGNRIYVPCIYVLNKID